MSFEIRPLLLRQRLSALDDARRGVGAALAVEHAARQMRGSAEAAIVSETRIALRSDSDVEVEHFAQWLRQGQARLASADSALAEAITVTTLKRAELTLVRAAAQKVARTLRKRHDGELQRRLLVAELSPDSGDPIEPDAQT